MGGFGSGNVKRINSNSVNELLAICYQLTVRLLHSKTVSNEKKLDIASRLVQRIIPERFQVDTNITVLTEAERLAELDSLAAVLARYRPEVNPITTIHLRAVDAVPPSLVLNVNAPHLDKRIADTIPLEPEPDDAGVLPVVKVTTLSAASAASTESAVTPAPPDSPPAAPAPPL